MSMLSRVTTGKIKRPLAIIVYGPDGVGKTTFGAEAPNPIFLGPEQGTSNLDVARFPNPESWKDVQDATDDLIKEQHSYQTLVVDSLDWIEPLVHDKVCADNGNAKTIELAAGGYGKGYKEAVKLWSAWRNKLDVLRDKKNMNIVFLAHAEIKAFNDPQNQVPIDRFQLKLYRETSAMFREYVEAVLFVNLDTFVKKEGERVKAFGDGDRVAFTERRPGFDAKNRFDLPQKLPLIRGESWKTLMEAIDRGSPESHEAVRKRLLDLVEECQLPDVKTMAIDLVEKAGDNTTKLLAIEQKLKIRMFGDVS